MQERISNACPLRHGDVYSNMSLTHDDPDWLWISQPVKPILPYSDVEVVHSNDRNNPNEKFTLGGRGYWMYAAKGSSNVVNVGRTRVFQTHADAERFTGYTIDDPSFYKELIGAKLDSIQFVKHNDMKCGNAALEIIHLHGNENATCLESVRSGWPGSTRGCVCDESKRFLNCSISST